MKIILILLSVSLLASCSSGGKRSAASEQDLSANVQAAAKEAYDKKAFPALGVLVVQNGKLIHQSVQGVRAIQFDTPAQLTDVFHLGSDTKAMTAYLVAMAVAEGKLQYDLPLKTLKGFKVHDDHQALTVKDLLGHRTSLKDVQAIANGEIWKETITSKKSLRSQRARMSKASLEEAGAVNPETGKLVRGYRNINYVIAGSILENIYNKPWEQLLREKLFAPLKMKSCGFGVAGRSNENLPSQPWAHFEDEGKLTGAPPKYKVDNPAMLGPAGTVHCSLENWNKFITELTSAHRGMGSLIASKSVLDTHFTLSGEEAFTFGGWGRNDSKLNTPIYQHAGSNKFNFAIAIFVPERSATVLLTTNSGTLEAEAELKNLVKKIMELLFPELKV